MNEPKSIMMKISVQNFKASLGKFEVLTINFWVEHRYISLSRTQRYQCICMWKSFEQKEVWYFHFSVNVRYMRAYSDQRTIRRAKPNNLWMNMQKFDNIPIYVVRLRWIE